MVGEREEPRITSVPHNNFLHVYSPTLLSPAFRIKTLGFEKIKSLAQSQQSPFYPSHVWDPVSGSVAKAVTVVHCVCVRSGGWGLGSDLLLRDASIHAHLFHVSPPFFPCPKLSPVKKKFRDYYENCTGNRSNFFILKPLREDDCTK